jgi:hypothetical protein
MMSITLRDTLTDALTRLTVDDLKALLKILPVVEKLTRKGELVERIAATMLGAELPALWSRLNSMQQTAVAEAVHHPLGEYSARRFYAQYQCDPLASSRAATTYAYGSSHGSKTELNLFMHYSHEQGGYFVPSDLRSELKKFVPSSAPLRLKSTETPVEKEGSAALTMHLSERVALQEVMVMLRTLEQARIQVSEKTALPNTATLRLLSEKLAGGDFYPWGEKKDKWDQAIGPIRAFAWPLLLQAGGLAVRNANRLALSPAGVKSLSAAPESVLRGLWRKWLKNTLLDEFSRIDEIKGQNGKGRVMTALAPRRAVIEEALRGCPVGRWVSVDALSRFMLASDQLFEVTHAPWDLYIVNHHYGNLGYDGSNGWNILQERYLLALLFEYAATLGLVDVAYADPVQARQDFRDLWGTDDFDFLSRYDGLSAFRLTPLGAYVLGLSSDYQPAAIVSNVKLSVLPSLLVNVVQGELSPEEVLLLENWADPLQAASWRLDREKALSAIEKGYDIAELRKFLQNDDDMPLPESVDAFIRQCLRNGKALKTIGNAVLIECRDAETTETIASHQETATLCLRAGPKMLAVRSEHVEKFRERVRLLGFGMAI